MATALEATTRVARLTFRHVTETIGVVLAGGRSTRMNGDDKAFISLGGRPLLAHVMTRLHPQVGKIVINSNADPRRFRAFGMPVIADILSGYLGPLAGIHAGLATFPENFILTVAVDLPFVPRDLAARLREISDGEHCCYASDGFHHALAILWPPGMAAAVENFLKQGKHSIQDWLALHGKPAIFRSSADADIRFNVNSPADLAQAEQFLSKTNLLSPPSQ